MKLYTILVALMLYFPAEDFILKWIPVSELVYSLMRLSSELIVYGFLVMVILNRVIKGHSIRRTPIDIPLMLFILCAVASIILNNAPVFGGFASIRTLLRYVAVYYAIVNLNISEHQVHKLIRLVIAIAVIESLIGFSQIGGISGFWLPRQSDFEIGGIKKGFTVLLAGGIEKGAVIGTFGHTVAMGLYLFIASCILAVRIAKSKRFAMATVVAASILIAGISLTYSRGILLGALTAFAAAMYVFRRRWFFIGSGISVAGVLFVALLSVVGFFTVGGVEYQRANEVHVGPAENIAMIFSSQFAASTEQTRGWMITTVGTAILSTGTVFGFSPDDDTARRKIAESSSGLTRVITYRGFKDVFMVALLAYYGIAGVTLFLLIMVRLFKAARAVSGYDNINESYKELAAAVTILIPITILLSFIIRTFEFRAFAFLFWVVAGLVMAQYLRTEKKELR